MSTYLNSVSKPPVCHGAWMETDDIFISPGHELVPVHGMLGMSLGHFDTLTFCFKKPYVMATAWRLIVFPCPRNTNWFLFLACVICPWDISTHLHSVSKTTACHGHWMETDYISMSPGHELVPVHGMRNMSLGHIDTFAFCINVSRISWHLDGDW